MKYTRKQLIKGLEEYYRDMILTPEEFFEPEQPFENAVVTIDLLIEIMGKQKQ